MRHALIPHLVVTDEQYEAAVAGLAAHRPDLTLTHRQWLDPESWELIPDGQGRPSKAELFAHRATSLLSGHVIVNLWLAPDLRNADRPQPHSHPAAFTSHILLGAGEHGAAYTETRYRRVNADVWTEHHSYRQGQDNEFPLDLFHEVVEVCPGSVTLMCWGPIVQAGRWGYVDPDTGAFTRTGPDAGFRARLAALNPHRKY